MANEGMEFMFSLDPFTVVGKVGEEVGLQMACKDVTLESRAQFDELIRTLERLREEVSMVNCWEGEWNISFSGVPQVKEESDGVPVQNLD